MKGSCARIVLTVLLAVYFGHAEVAAQEAAATAQPLESRPAPASALPPTPRPPHKLPSKGAFPFARWSYAKAYTFNFFEMRPAPLRVIDASGIWSPHINSEILVSDEIALRAANLVATTRGSVELTKCTFPRHAIVYFDADDKPVASAAVCFDCEAVLAWPDYPKPEDFNHTRMAAKFEKALPLWRRLFERDLALPIDWRSSDKSAVPEAPTLAGQALKVRPNSIWFQDVAMLKSWQSLKSAGNEPALRKFEDTALAERGAMRFSNALEVTVIRIDPDTKEVEVEMSEPGRLAKTRWHIDAEALER